MNKKILMVDDEPSILNSFGRRLRKQGFEIVTAGNGTDALEKLKTFAPDLIISDMRMPEMDGVQLFKSIKDIPDCPGFSPGKIIFTAFDDGEALELAHLGQCGVFRVEKDRWETDLDPAIARALELQEMRQKAWEQGKELQEAEIDRQVTAKVRLDLQLGNAIQQRFLTSAKTVIDLFARAGYGVEIFNQAPMTVSGDFYYPKAMNGSAVGLFFADTCGHGVAAAFLSMRILSIIDHLRPPNNHASEFLETVSDDICGLMPSEKFVAASYLIFKKDKIVLANAGQPHPLLLRNGKVQELELGGMPLGQILDFDYRDVDLVLNPGERLILYTDGITEAVNTEEDIYGKKRLIACLQKNTRFSLAELKESIIADVRNFVGNVPLEDDITLMLFERKESKQ